MIDQQRNRQPVDAQQDPALAARIKALEQENAELKGQVKLLKEMLGKGAATQP
jgi:uncharacterized protein (UPF0335 family)